MTADRRTLWLMVMAVLCAAAVWPIDAAAAQSGRDQQSPEERASGSEAPEYISPEVARLEMFLGVWRVTQKHLDAQGEVIAEAKGSEEITFILDDRAIQRLYTSSSEAAIFRAVGILTWDSAKKKYRGTWFDNTSMAGPSLVEGEWQEKERSFVFTIESTGPDGSPLRHKVIEHFPKEDRRVATTYRLDGDSSVKLLEVKYKRAIPCPGKLRVIFDGLEKP